MFEVESCVCAQSGRIRLNKLEKDDLLSSHCRKQPSDDCLIDDG